MLFGLRYFERSINNSPGGSSSKLAFCWGEVDMKSFAKCILSTCHSLREILINEPRLLKIDSPTYILGKKCIWFFISQCSQNSQWRLTTTIISQHDHDYPLLSSTIIFHPLSSTIILSCHYHHVPPHDNCLHRYHHRYTHYKYLHHFPLSPPSSSVIIFHYHFPPSSFSVTTHHHHHRLPHNLCYVPPSPFIITIIIFHTHLSLSPPSPSTITFNNHHYHNSPSSLRLSSTITTITTTIISCRHLPLSSFSVTTHRHHHDLLPQSLQQPSNLNFYIP